MAVAILTRLSPALLQEGLARELVHHIQNTRKAADFQIDDRVHLRVFGPVEVSEMLAVHGDWVKKETLAVNLEVSGDAPTDAAFSGDQPAGDGWFGEHLKVNGLPVTVEVTRA